MSSPDPPGRRRFATTRWTLVLAAGDRGSDDAETALASLCETYWMPVYAFIRRSGHDVDAASDLTQAFFTRVLEKNFFARARRERGRFRTFLLSSVRNFLANERERARAAKRGGGRAPMSLNVDDGERTYQIELPDAVTPEHLYERRWALTAIAVAMRQVQERYARSNKAELFRRLKPYLAGQADGSYADVAADLDMREGTVRVAVHRMRREFASALRRTIAETVEGPEDVEGELRHLLTAVAQPGTPHA
jgi:RNA polymerase sigma factor (sigma-70 family)